MINKEQVDDAMNVLKQYATEGVDTGRNLLVVCYDPKEGHQWQMAYGEDRQIATSLVDFMMDEEQFLTLMTKVFENMPSIIRDRIMQKFLAVAPKGDA